MQRFKNISLIYECDKATRSFAAKLAKDNRAQLAIVHALQDLPAHMQSVTIGDKPIDVRKLVLRERQQELAECAKAVRSLGVRPTTRLLIGDPSREIIRDVIENKRDLVIMTAEGKGGLKDRLFGSTSSHLMRKCPVPLLVVKPGRQKRVRRVLAAVDPEISGDARDTLNGTILDLAANLCSREGAELHVVHAWTMLGESLLRRGGLNVAEVKRWLQTEAQRRRQMVDDLLVRNGVSHARIHLVKGEAAESVLWVAEREHIDLLVMRTVCRTGIPGFIIGNTAEKVLGEVNCSVLTVKPVGFVTPVAPKLMKASA